MEILKPDAVLRAERVPVGQMGDVFSGGQLLTAAIALYCTMAALRSNDRGRDKHRHAGTLFLDNPIGRANATYLLELQRAVSDALGVQLLYTTGLFDTTALAEFPLVIRLRNDADLRAGLKYISVEEHLRPGLPQQDPDESDGGARRDHGDPDVQASTAPTRADGGSVRRARHGFSRTPAVEIRGRISAECDSRAGRRRCPAIRSWRPLAWTAPAAPPAPGAARGARAARRAAGLRDHAVALVPHLPGHPHVQDAPGGHHRADHAADAPSGRPARTRPSCTGRPPSPGSASRRR